MGDRPERVSEELGARNPSPRSLRSQERSGHLGAGQICPVCSRAAASSVSNHRAALEPAPQNGFPDAVRSHEGERIRNAVDVPGTAGPKAPTAPRRHNVRRS